jgi:hypothetical protein
MMGPDHLMGPDPDGTPPMMGPDHLMGPDPDGTPPMMGPDHLMGPQRAPDGTSPHTHPPALT